MKYQLTEEASKDIEKILEYTIINFGVDQAENYFETLKEGIELLADNPKMGFSAADVLPGYFRFPFQSHVIYYKILSSSIQIIRVLHQQMEPERHIK